MMMYSTPTGLDESALQASIFGTGTLVCEFTGTRQLCDISGEGERYHTVLKNSSFGGRGVLCPSCIRARNLRDHFHSVLCSYQKGFAVTSLHLIDFANRSSILGERRDHITQLSDVKFNASL